MKRQILAAALFLCSGAYLSAQIHVSPEEVAIMHLDLLVQADTSYSNIHFYADGRFFLSAVDNEDTLSACYKSKEPNCKFVNPLKGKIVHLNEKLKKFPCPKKFKQNSKYPILEVHRAFEQGTNFVIVFGISTSVFVKTVIILTLDKDGNLIKKCLSKATEEK